MFRFIQKYMEFMRGRNGMDTLNRFLLGLSLFLWFVNIFVFNRLASLIIYLVELFILAWMIFRALSTNIVMRSKENRTFLKAYNPIKSKIKFEIKKFKERKDFKYLKCPFCKVQLRVKNQKGNHGVKCPKCGGKFEVKI